MIPPPMMAPFLSKLTVISLPGGGGNNDDCNKITTLILAVVTTFLSKLT